MTYVNEERVDYCVPSVDDLVAVAADEDDARCPRPCFSPLVGLICG